VRGLIKVASVLNNLQEFIEWLTVIRGSQFTIWSRDERTLIPAL